MAKAIREAGRVPYQRNTFYEPVKEFPNAEAEEPEANERRSPVLERNLATG
jgi:hypothetical protein